MSTIEMEKMVELIHRYSDHHCGKRWSKMVHLLCFVGANIHGHLPQAGSIEGLSLGNTIVARKNITLGPSQIRYRKKEGQAAAGDFDSAMCS